MATDLAEFIGAALGLNLLFGIPLFPAGLITGLIAFLILGLQARGFRQLEAVIVGLVGVIVAGFAFQVIHADASATGVLTGLVRPRFADTHQAMVTQQMGRRAGAVGVAPRPLVLLWVRDERRGELLRDLLAVGGMEATAWVGDAAPPAIVEQQPVQALVIAGDQSIERLQAVRAHAETKTLPVMVVDVTRGEDVPLLIRAGASDATMRSVADDQIAKKVSRMIQRKR